MLASLSSCSVDLHLFQLQDVSVRSETFCDEGQSKVTEAIASCSQWEDEQWW